MIRLNLLGGNLREHIEAVARHRKRTREAYQPRFQERPQRATQRELVKDVYAEIGTSAARVFNDGSYEPEWYADEQDFPRWLRERVESAPALSVGEDERCPINPDLWDEDYERELILGFHGGGLSVSLGDMIGKLQTSADNDWKQLQGFSRRRTAVREDRYASKLDKRKTLYRRTGR